MKIVVKKSSLEVCVRNLVRVINDKNALPILADILWDVNEQEMLARLTSSDGEIWLNTEVELDVCEGGGRFTVLGQTLSNMLVEISDQPLTITATAESDKVFTLSYADGKAYCPMRNADEYPTPKPVGSDTELVTLDASVLKRTIKRSLWATANEELRPVLNGIKFDIVNGELNVVSTNGHVMTKNQDPVSFDYNSPSGFIMPKKVAKILPEMLNDGECDMMFSENVCTLEQASTSLQFTLVEGKYPAYDSVIPKTFAHSVTVDRLFLLSAVRAMSPFAPEASNMVEMVFYPDGRLNIMSTDTYFGIGGNKSILVEGYTGEEMHFGMKAESMISMLSRLSEPTVRLKFNGPGYAVIIETVTDGDSHFTGLIMPMLLSD